VKSAVSQLETKLGRKLDVDSHYYGWTSAFPDWKQSWDAESGRISMVSWQGASSSRINSGAFDSMIKARAGAVARYGKPTFIRYFWGMDLSNPDTVARAGSPAEFIAAWRRMHGIFRAEGATNALFVWCPDAWGFSTGRAQSFYPGDAYVDWMCAEGYNWAPAKPGAPWRSFSQIFSDYYAWASQRGKPLMIGETGALEGSPGQKAAWINGARETIETKFPQTHALIYFDAVSNYGGTYDWRIDSSDSSLAAFQGLAHDSRFNVPSGVVPGMTAGARARVVKPYRAFAQGSHLAVAWHRPKAGAQPVSYEVRYEAAAATGGFGRRISWIDRTTTMKRSLRGRPGHTYCFSARARLADGRLSKWSVPKCTSVPLDDRALQRDRRWHRRTGRSFYQGTYLVTNRRGAKVSTPRIRARRIALLIQHCARCGQVQVLWRSRVIRTLSLTSRRMSRSPLVSVVTFRSVRRGRLVIRVTSSGRRVAIDGVGISKK
jgi:hypothetical protein